MKIEKKETFLLVTSNEESFSDFYNSFLNQQIHLHKEHLVVQISKTTKITAKELLLIIKISEEKKENNKSFVLVNSDANVSSFPENFNIVPTLQEAEDILEMEAIERELGF
ncbi:MAG: hypothetical protein P8L21_05145 [Polaribacter sp.]|jgi:hypothetical protein|nr:hypothetical protein [Polaribacter sp.]MDG2357649.1 hypothetical protein [Polaribacter sp.]